VLHRLLTACLATTCLVTGALSPVACVDPVPPWEKPLATHVVDWRDEVIYQVLVDRFANGDFSNDYRVNVHDPAAYHGGDWIGLQGKLDYLVELGVTALWISPVVKNVEWDAGYSSYHGYWAQDFTRPNPHFGDLSALRELVDAAHARGLKVVLDVVTNHVGQAFFYDINKNGQPDEFFIGQGGRIIPLDQAGAQSDLVRITEWDPDFDARGIQAWTSLGPSGLAPLVFANDPEINRVKPEPWPFGEPWAYNARGRVTVWTDPAVCGCEAWGCPWDDPCRRTQEILGDFPGGLKDLRTDHPTVREALLDVYTRWIDIADFDGFRIDTLKHVEAEYFEDFCPRVRAHAAARGKRNFFMFGEAFDGDDRLLGSYTHGEGVDSVFYFSQYYELFRGAMLGGGARTCAIERLHCRRHGCDADPCREGGAIEALYSGEPRTGGVTGANGEGLNPRQLVVNFVENHDVGRFLYFMPEDWTRRKKREVLHLALTWVMTIDGVPSLYYGVEQEFDGGNDPANRETMWRPEPYSEQVWAEGRWQHVPRTYDAAGDGRDDTVWGPFDRGNPTFRFIQHLNAVRKEHVSLRRGGLQFRWSTLGAGGDDHGLVAFERPHHEETAVLAFNLAHADGPAAVATMAVAHAPGTVLVDRLDPATELTVGARDSCDAGPDEGCLTVEVPRRRARILVPR